MKVVVNVRYLCGSVTKETVVIYSLTSLKTSLGKASS